MANCNYTPDYIDQRMTLPRLAGLKKYWSAVPPLSISTMAIAHALGFDWQKAQAKAGSAEAAKKAAGPDAAATRAEFTAIGFMGPGGVLRG